MKKYGILIAVFLVALTMCFAAAEEAEPTVYTSGDYQYTLLADGTAQITDYTGKADKLTVPNTLDGHPVTSIGDDAFSKCPEDMLFTVERDSYGAQWCKDNGKNYTYPDSLDWLND